MKKNSKSTKKSGKSGIGELPLLESVKCPVCMELLLSPIYQCERGHNICNVCIEEVDECPLCKGDYGDTRNYFAEELVNSMTLPCKYQEYGCTYTCLGSDLKKHQDDCEFQPYRCPELACQELLGKGEMSKHLDKHGFQVLKGDSHVATIDIQDKHFDVKTEYTPWRIQTFNREFYIVASRQKNKDWHFWSWILALPQDAKKYSCEIMLTSNDRQVLLRGPVHSLRTSAEELVKGHSSLVIKDQLIKSMRENDRITCKVQFIEGRNWDKSNNKKEGKNLTKASTEVNPGGSCPTKPLVSARVKKPTKKDSTATKKEKRSPTPFRLPHRISQLPTSEKLMEITKILAGSNVSGSTGSKALVPKASSTTASKSVTLTSPNASKASAKPKIAPKKGTGAASASIVVSESEQNFVLKLRESLKCPGCKEEVTPPIQLCTIGHSVCENCRIKEKNNCPLCHAPITGTRNFFAEELLYKTVQKCRYFNAGCEVCLPAVQIILHEKMCEFAPFQCPFSTCRRSFEPKDLLDHMKSHGIPQIENEILMDIPFPKTVDTPVCAIPVILMIKDQPFYPLILREPDGFWCFWVASSDPNVKFLYELRLKKQSKILVFQGSVMPLRLSPNEIVLRGEGLLVTDKLMKTFKTNDHFDFSLRVVSTKSIYKSNNQFLVPFPVKRDTKASPEIITTEIVATKRTSKTNSSFSSAFVDRGNPPHTFRVFLGDSIQTHVIGSRPNLDEDTDEELDQSVSSTESFKRSNDGEAESNHSASVESLSELVLSDVEEIEEALLEEAIEASKEAEMENEDETSMKVDEKSNVSPIVTESEEFLVAGSAKSELSTKVVKTKSLLKLKAHESNSELRLKQSLSLKKVEFNPKTEISIIPSLSSSDNRLITEDDSSNSSNLASLEAENAPDDKEAENAPDDEEAENASDDKEAEPEPTDQVDVEEILEPIQDEFCHTEEANAPSEVSSLCSDEKEEKICFEREDSSSKIDSNDAQQGDFAKLSDDPVSDIVSNEGVVPSEQTKLGSEDVEHVRKLDDELGSKALTSKDEDIWKPLIELDQENRLKLNGDENVNGNPEDLEATEKRKSSSDLIDLQSQEDPNPALLSMGDFDGPIEITIRAANQTTSLSLSNINLNKESKVIVQGETKTDGNVVSNFAFNVPTSSKEPDESEFEEIVDEADISCQVGDSLMKLVEKTTDIVQESSQYKIDPENSELLDLHVKRTASKPLNASTYVKMKNLINGVFHSISSLSSKSTSNLSDNLNNNAEDDVSDSDIEVDIPPLIPGPIAHLPPNY